MILLSFWTAFEPCLSDSIFTSLYVWSGTFKVASLIRHYTVFPPISKRVHTIHTMQYLINHLSTSFRIFSEHLLSLWEIETNNWKWWVTSSLRSVFFSSGRVCHPVLIILHPHDDTTNPFEGPWLSLFNADHLCGLLLTTLQFDTRW